MKKLILLTFILAFSSSISDAQSFQNITLQQNDSILFIQYDFTGRQGYSYDIGVIINSKNQGIIKPTSISGALNGLTTGSGYYIAWCVLKDIQSLEGNISVELKILRRHTTQGRMDNHADGRGPENAFLSMLLPGLGDVFVNDEDPIIKPIYISLAFLGSAGLAIYGHNQSKKYEEAAKNSVMEYEINNNLEQAAYYQSNSALMGVFCATIWVCDVIWVVAKGASNRKGTSGPIHYPEESRTKLRVGSNGELAMMSLTYRF